MGATFDVDAQLVETAKKGARYCYEGYRASQPMEVEWAETGLVLADELREGNVHPGRGKRRHEPGVKEGDFSLTQRICHHSPQNDRVLKIFNQSTD